MRCPNCGKEMVRMEGIYPYHESGLKNVTLVNVPMYKCPACKETEVEIPRLEELHLLLAFLIVLQPDPLKGEEVRYLHMLEGSCVWTTHVRQQMKERGIDNNDLLALARVGLVLNSPEPHPVTGEWTYRMESKTPEVKVVFTVLGESRIRLLTVIAD